MCFATVIRCGETDTVAPPVQSVIPVHSVIPVPVPSPVVNPVVIHKQATLVGSGFHIFGNNGEYCQRGPQIFNTKVKGFQGSDHLTTAHLTREKYSSEKDITTSVNGKLKLGVDTPEYGATISSTFKIVRGLVDNHVVVVDTSRFKAMTLSATNTLELSQAFLADLQKLPQKVDDMHTQKDPKQFSEAKGKYMSFLRKWGTHYIQTVTLGGEFIIISKVKKTQRTSDVNVDASIDAKIKMVTAGVGGGVSRTKKTTKENVQFEFRALGGSADKLSTLLATLNSDSASGDIYKEWAASIAAEPSVVSFGVRSIGNVIPDDSEILNDKQQPGDMIRKNINAAIPIYNGVEMLNELHKSENEKQDAVDGCHGTAIYDMYIDTTRKKGYSCQAHYTEFDYNLNKYAGGNAMRLCILRKPTHDQTKTIKDVDFTHGNCPGVQDDLQPIDINMGAGFWAKPSRMCVTKNEPDDNAEFITDVLFTRGSKTHCPRGYKKVPNNIKSSVPVLGLYMCVYKCRNENLLIDLEEAQQKEYAYKKQVNSF